MTRIYWLTTTISSLSLSRPCGFSFCIVSPSQGDSLSWKLQYTRVPSSLWISPCNGHLRRFSSVTDKILEKKNAFLFPQGRSKLTIHFDHFRGVFSASYKNYSNRLLDSVFHRNVRKIPEGLTFTSCHKSLQGFVVLYFLCELLK